MVIALLLRDNKTMFKSIEVKKSSLDKVRYDHGELLKNDIEGQLKSFTPGEWVLLKDPHRKRVYLAFVNPLVDEKFPAVRFVTRLKSAPVKEEVEKYIEDTIVLAIDKRFCFTDYQLGCRVIYGDADGLPGLVVDKYQNCALIQINTAGIDRYRSLVLDILKKKLQTECYFINQPALRAKEILPHYRDEVNLEIVRVMENDFHYEIPVRNLQKIGWYYDHRENRRKMESAVSRWNGDKSIGVDLFCYGGSWGLHLLRAGVKNVKFVDQAPLKDLVTRNLEINKFTNRAEFIREDVFDWLEGEHKAKSKYAVIVSDPPAFAKSPKEKTSAIEGYKKLHRRVFKVASPGALIAFASCTHYLSQDEFINTITYAADQEHLKIQILEMGMQGWDHPVSSLSDRSNYIKYVLIRAGE